MRSARFHLRNVRCCPVCRASVSRTVETCSPECSERLDDARDSIGWIRVKTSDLCAALSELEETLGLIQLKLEAQEQKLRGLSKNWTTLALEGRFAKANKLRRVALSTQRRVRRLSRELKPLYKRWEVLKPEVVHAEQELQELEAILRGNN